jgi:hypothetical protein
MKSLASLAALVLAVGCASSNAQSSGDAAKLQVQLAQVGTSNAGNLYYFAGPINVQYQLAITNPTTDTFTLRRIDLRTTSSGAYSLRTPNSPITAPIPPGKTTVINLSAWGRSSGSYLSANEPVTIQGTVYFDGPHGNFVKVFNQMLTQFGS